MAKTKLIFTRSSCEFYPSARHKNALTYGDPFEVENPERYLDRDLAMKPKDFVARHLAKAARFVDAGRPDKARVELDRVMAVDAKNKQATELQKAINKDEE